MNLSLEAFNQLYREYYGRFNRYAYSYVKDKSVAEDFTSETFLQYWESRHSLAPGSNIPAYILKIIKNKCLNYLEHIRIQNAGSEQMQRHSEWELRTRIATLEACDPTELLSNELQHIIDKTLQTLPEQTRHIFILSRYYNKSHKEIASTCHIGTKAVEFHITKALKALRINLKDYF
ncbi:DNA-directed RNA polymerase sigma-70 factor [Bacteroidia bacterium]|nr:DNA-directed RNA polymerase sigma-70 factor [Bacteroidia bacterium]